MHACMYVRGRACVSLHACVCVCVKLQWTEDMVVTSLTTLSNYNEQKTWW